MTLFFKQAYIPYISFLAGIVLIFFWARSRKGLEGFENNGLNASYITAAPYKFTMYYADWCPHCHSAKPEFEKLGATQTIGGKKVACSAIEAEKNPEKVKEKVNGYPTFRFYDAEGQMTEYNGERNAKGFQSFLEDMMNRPQ